MLENFRDRLKTALLHHAEALYDFEAPEVQPGVPAGSRTDYVRFHIFAREFLSELADRLAGEYGGAIFVRRGKKHWRKIVHGKRACYIPCAAPPFNAICASVPKWLSAGFSASGPVAPGEGEIAGKINFSFKEVIGLVDEGCPPCRIVIDYVTGKSSKGEKMDGNAHERLSYKILQYVEMLHLDALEMQCRLFIFGNGAFVKYSNKFYPSTLMHLERLGALVKRFEAGMAVDVDGYLRLALEIADWLRPRSPALLRRRYVIVPGQDGA